MSRHALSAFSGAARTYATAVGGKAAAVKVRREASDGSDSLQLPIQPNGLPGTYAGAAFSAALSKSEQTLSGLDKDLSSISGALAKDTKLQAFLQNPTLSPKDRDQGLSDLLKLAKDGAGGITKNLFTVLAENGRLALSERVIGEFQNIMSAHRGEVTITITSAQPLDSATQKKLESTLKESQAAKAGKSVRIVNKVQPSVVGGLLVDFGEKSIDLTVASRVNKLNTMLEQSV